MSKRCVTEEIVLPREYIKGEIFIDLGTTVEDYLKSLDKPKSAETKKKQLNFILLQNSKTDIMKKCLLKKKNYLEII